MKHYLLKNFNIITILYQYAFISAKKCMLKINKVHIIIRFEK